MTEGNIAGGEAGRRGISLEVDDLLDEEMSSQEQPTMTIRRIIDLIQMKSDTNTNSSLHDITVSLVENDFGYLIDSNGQPDYVKRFTWKNQHSIEVSVITYGARIISMKLPDKRGHIEDVALGFDNLAAYLHYDYLPLGAIMGRTSNRIKNASYPIHGKIQRLSNNDNGHHMNGGYNGFDKVNWIPTIKDSKLVLSYTSKNREEGYPGEVTISVQYELTKRNEFKIEMLATTTKPTLVDLSSSLFFNLAGHEKGYEELKKHCVQINADAYLPLQNGFPNGKLAKVAHTRNDFRKMTLFDRAMGLSYDKDFDTHFCINRGVDQGMAYVARVSHPFSGRCIEIHSNNYGVNLNTGKAFGTSLVNISPMIVPPLPSNLFYAYEEAFKVVTYFRLYLTLNPWGELEEWYETLMGMVKNVLQDLDSAKCVTSVEVCRSNVGIELTHVIKLKPIEIKFLDSMLHAIETFKPDYHLLRIKFIIEDMLMKSASNNRNDRIPGETEPLIADSFIQRCCDLPNSGRSSSVQLSEQSSVMGRISDVLRYGLRNQVPNHFKDGRVHGKGNVIYKRVSSMCLRTENWPNAVYHKNFPSPFLYPEETYKHNITYKFYLLTGDPRKYLKQIQAERDPCSMKSVVPPPLDY